MHAKLPQWPAPRGPTQSCCLVVLGHLLLSRLVSAEGLALRRLLRSREPEFGCSRLLEQHIYARMQPVARSITRPGGGPRDEI
jgi:hypothetical protein